MEIKIQDERVLLYLKMGVMFSNGIPIITALKILEKESYNKSFKKAMKTIREKLEEAREEGHEKLVKSARFSTLLAEHPDLLDKGVLELIRAAEKIGALDLVTRNLPEFLLYFRLPEWKE